MKEPRIKKGARVWILPEWQDEGDDGYTWIALEDSTDERGEMPRIDIGAVELAERFSFPPRSRVDVTMITTEEPNTGE